MAGRTAEVNSNVLLCKTLWDGNTGKGVRARVFDANGAEVSGSPFTLTHRVGGHYSGNGWNPTLEGQYSVSYEIYTTTGFTAADRAYEWDDEEIEVRSVDQDLATLLSRLTAGRAANLDNLDATVSSRSSQTSLDALSTKIGTPAAASVSLDIASVYGRIGAPVGASISADIASVKSDTGTLTSRLTNTRATNLDNLDTTISSRQSAATALSQYNALQADTDDIQLKIGTPAVSLASDIAGVQTTANAVNTKLGTPAGASVSADIAAVQTRLGTPANATVSADIAAVQTKLGTPANSSVSADLAAVKTDTGTLTSRLTTGRAAALDNLDATISSRQSTATALTQFTALQADTDDIQAKIGSPVGTLATDIAGVQTKLGTPAGASVSADIAAVKSDTGTLTTRLTAGRAGNLDFLDAAITSRESEADAEARHDALVAEHAALSVIIGVPVTSIAADIAGVQTTANAVNTKIGTPAGASVSADVAAVKGDTAAILVDTGTSGVLVAAASRAAIVDEVWDELAAAHSTTGTFGAFANLLDDIESDTATLNDTKLTSGRAANLDFIDVAVSSRASTVDLDHVHEEVDLVKALIGTPAGASLSADVAAIQSDTNDIQSKIGSPVGTLASDIAGVQSTAGVVNTKLGTPAGASLSADIASTHTRIGAPVGASISADIQAAKSQLGVIESKIDDLSALGDSSVSIPQTFIVPASGTNVYRIYWRHYTSGTPSDPAVGPDITIEKSDGTDIVSSVGMTKESDGVYYYDYTLASTAEVGLQVLVKVTYMNDVMGAQFEAIATANQTQSDSVIDDILDLLGAPLSGTVSGDILLSLQGQQTIGAKLGDPVVSFAGDLASIKADSVAIKAKTDQLAFTGANLNVNAQVVSDKTGYALSTTDKNTLIDLAWNRDLAALNAANSASVFLKTAAANLIPTTSIDAIADAVWDEQRSLHSTLGSFGEAVQGVISDTRAANLDFLDVAVSTRTSETLSLAMAAKLGDPTNGTFSADLAALLADTDAIQMTLGSPVGASLSVDIAAIKADSGTLTSRLTATRATNLDRLDTTVSSRQTSASALSQYNALQADLDDVLAKIGTPSVTLADDILAVNTKLGTPNGANVSADIAAVQSTVNAVSTKIGTPVGISVSADIAAVKAETAAILDDTGTTGVAVSSAARALIVNSVWDEPAAGHVTAGTFGKRLDADVSTRESEASAATRYQETDAHLENLQTDTDDIQAKIGFPAGASVSADIATIVAILAGGAITVDAIKAKTDQLTFTNGNVNADAKVVSDKTGYALSTAGLQAVSNEIWDEPLINHQLNGTTGQAMGITGAATPAAIASEVWDTLVASHNLPNTFGNYLQVVRQNSVTILAEVNNSTYGLAALRAQAGNNATSIITEVNQNETKINAILPAISSTQAFLKAEIDANQTAVEALSAQLASTRADILDEFADLTTMLDTLSDDVGAIQNNTTARFIVPDRLIKPNSGTKTYQFQLRLYDETGNAQAPDSKPTIRVRRLDTGVDIILDEEMTQDGAKVGAYYFDFNITSGTDEYTMIVEATVVEGGATRYIPAVSEITEFESDLNAIQSQLSAVQSTVTSTQSAVTNGVYGLAALKTSQNNIVSEIDQNEAAIATIKSQTDLIPASPATAAQVAAVGASVLTRPALADIVTELNLVRDYIMGPDNRNITSVYDKFDLSSVMKTNDARLNYLDASVASRSTLDANAVWAHPTRTLTNYSLAAASIKAIWDYLASQANVNGSLGKLLADNLDAKVSTRATAVQVSSALSGVAQESTVSSLAGIITSGDNQTQIDLAAVAADVTAIKGKTQNLPADPASASAVASSFASQATAIASLDLKATGIKSKTDNLPSDPARETSVQARPTNPLLANDVRLSRLDVAVSTRGTLSASDVAGLATASGLASTQTALTSEINANETKINTINSTLGLVKAKTDLIPAQPVSKPQLDSAVSQIIAEIDAIEGGGGSGITAADVWTYPARTITQDPLSFGPDISNLATKDDIDEITVNTSACRMSTALNSTDGTQEAIVWLEKNGEPLASASNARIKVKNAAGDTLWEANLASPNADGVFAFSTPFVPPAADQNYYVEMVISDGSSDVSGRSAFITVG